MAINKKQLNIVGMQCAGCEDVICEALKALPGVQTVSASYPKARVAIEFDSKLLDEASIQQCLAEKGYTLEAGRTAFGWIKRVLVFLILLLLVGGVAFWGKSLMPNVTIGYDPDEDRKRFSVSPGGVVVIPKGAEVR